MCLDIHYCSVYYVEGLFCVIENLTKKSLFSAYPMILKATILVSIALSTNCSILPCIIVGVGFTNGTVRVLYGVSLEDCCPPFHYSRDCVTHITFSHDSTYIATAV